MNDHDNKVSLAGRILGEEAENAAERESLRRSLMVLRRRRRQRKWIELAAPLTAAAAVAAAVIIGFCQFFRAGPSPEMAGEETVDSSFVVRSRPPGGDVIVQTRLAVERVRTDMASPGLTLVQTPAGRSGAVVVSSRPSRDLELLSDQQLIIAMAGRPFGFHRDSTGERRLFLLEESDRHLLWEP